METIKDLDAKKQITNEIAPSFSAILNKEGTSLTISGNILIQEGIDEKIKKGEGKLVPVQSNVTYQSNLSNKIYTIDASSVDGTLMSSFNKEYNVNKGYPVNFDDNPKIEKDECITIILSGVAEFDNSEYIDDNTTKRGTVVVTQENNDPNSKG